MKSTILGGALLGTLLLAGCARLAPSMQAQAPHHHVWDGIRPDAISRAGTPNLYALQQGGVNFTGNHSASPTFTMLNAASFATDSFPGTTGCYGNTLDQPSPPILGVRSTAAVT